MKLNVVRTGGEDDMYTHEMTAVFRLVLPLSDGETYESDSEVVGTIEVEEVLKVSPTGEVEAVKLNGSDYSVAGVNPIANKVVLKDGSDYGPFIDF